MLVTRQFDSGRHTWSSSKLGAIHQNPRSPRMSNLEQLTTQPNWREQYSQYLPPVDNTTLSPALNQPLGTHSADNLNADQQYGAQPHLEHRHTCTQSDTRRELSQTPLVRPDSSPAYVQPATNGPGQLISTDLRPQSRSSVTMNPTSPTAFNKPEMPGNTENDAQQVLPKEDHDYDDDEDDDDMVDAEDLDGRPPQTEAEIRAERRKMKRFRLTHQQTRFLMSEFAKQAHPDAAHRERLSREIPGLSARQVQVWFQNRRAKIKRLTADDRERMMKMRAVPDDFDSIQALHSPYGAVHGIGTPMVSPIDYTSYADHGMRPLMVDTMRRHEADEHVSPTGLSPAFGHVGFAPPGSMATPDVLSPLSLPSNERYYGGHISSPLSVGSRTTNPFNRQSSSDTYRMHSSRQHPRPLQPIQLRETMSRSRSESLQSPLRSSMSWKGDSLDYTEYPAGQTSPNNPVRPQPQYQPQQQPNNPVSTQQYETDAYNTPQTHVAFSSSQPPSLQSVTSTIPRFRSPPSAFPSGLDLRNQYRTIPSQHTTTVGSPHTPSSAPRSGGFVSNFTGTGFQSAPLSAPPEFQMPRTPIDGGPREYHISQLSAPMAPPQDFVTAYGHGVGISPNRASQAERAGRHEEHMATAEAYLQSESQNEGQKRRRAYSMGREYEEHQP